MGEPCSQETRLLRMEEDIRKLQSSDKDNNQNIADMKQSNAETRIYVTQIFDSLREIKVTLATVTDAPAKRWNNAVETLITVVITAAVTYFLAK